MKQQESKPAQSSQPPGSEDICWGVGEIKQSQDHDPGSPTNR